MLLSELDFGSFLTYSPNGQDEAAIESQDWVRRIKGESMHGSPPIPLSEHVARRLVARILETPLAQILRPSAILVPVPSSTLTKNASLWVPARLCEALVRYGLGREVVTCLERVTPLRKSATAAPGDRPKAQEHYDSMRVVPLPAPHDEIVIVDDVITTGATMLAAANHLREVLPGARIHGFAAVRTMSAPKEFNQMFDPCMGRINLRKNGSSLRSP